MDLATNDRLIPACCHLASLGGMLTDGGVNAWTSSDLSGVDSPLIFLHFDDLPR